MRTTTALIPVLLTFMAPAHANQLPPLHATKTVASGKPFKLVAPSTVNPDCTPLGEPAIRLERSPSHGKLRLSRGLNFGTYTGIYAACNSVRVKGPELWYTSERGYVGPDEVGIEVIFASGNARIETYTIDVR